MNVVIIPSDGFVSVNGRGFGKLDLSWISSEVHAVTWNGVTGEVQVVNPATRMIVRNDQIDNIAPFQQALDQWETARTEADAPPPPPSLSERRSTRWEQVKAERARREYGGIQAGGHWFQTDVQSQVKHQSNLIDAKDILAAGGAPTDVLTIGGQPVGWKTFDNGVVPLTVSLVMEIAGAIKVQTALSYARGQALYDEIMSSSDPESIDITTGWPAIYEA